MKTKICTTCTKEKKVNQFYKSKDHSLGVMHCCKDCFNDYAIQRWITRKVKAIEYKGNECEDCKINIKDTHYAIFEFHHINPKQKDHDWNKLRLMNWTKVLKELDKCVLLCANCHRIRHVSLRQDSNL